MTDEHGKKAQEHQSEQRNVCFPEDSFMTMTLTHIETSGAEVPEFVTFNNSYMGFDHKDIFQWMLEITVRVRQVLDGGLPDDIEAGILNDFEDLILERINPDKHQPNALGLGRTTCEDIRTIFFAVYDPEVANEALQEMIVEDEFGLQWEFQMESDPEWKSIQFYYEKYIEAAKDNSPH